MDEDSVVFEGTPLAVHLKSLGMQEFIEEVQAEEEEVLTQDRSFLHNAWIFFYSAMKSFKSTMIRDVYQQLCVNYILRADLLEDMDLEPLMTERKLQLDFSETALTWCLVKRGIRDTMLALVPVLTLSLFPRQTVGTKILALAPSVAILFAWRPLLSSHYKYVRLKKYLEYIKNYHVDLTRAIKLINENSLVNNGYFIGSRTCAHTWKLETPSLMTIYNPSEKCLPGLRIAVLETTSRLAVEYSSELRMARKLRPLPYNLDHPLLCLPMAEDFKDVSGEKYVSVPSLREIKKSIECCLVKEQEYFKRLLLDLISYDRDEFLNVALSDRLVMNVLDVTNELRMALIFYKTLYTKKTECKLKVPGEYQSMDRMSVFHSMCHSAKGHLEEALRGAISMEESLEDVAMEPLRLINLMALLLNKVNFHVDTTKNCLRRVSILVAKMKMVNQSVDLPGREMDQTISNDMDDAKVQVSSPSPVDEVFELIGENTVSEEPVDDVWEGHDAAELERESTQLVLQELKNVLHAKALDWEQREKKVKTLGRGICKEGSKHKDYGQLPVEKSNHVDFPSSLSLMNDSDQTASTLSSWVISGAGEPGIMVPLGVAPLEKAAGFDPSIISNLAAEAVAKVKLNQAFGVLTAGEDEFVITEED